MIASVMQVFCGRRSSVPRKYPTEELKYLHNCSWDAASEAALPEAQLQHEQAGEDRDRNRDRQNQEHEWARCSKNTFPG
jgi:hypothetical protein